MTRIIVDDTLPAKLAGMTRDVELCDRSGQPLGHFIPQKDYVRLMCALAESQCPYSPEELAGFKKETGGRPLNEIWKSLGAK